MVCSSSLYTASKHQASTFGEVRHLRTLSSAPGMAAENFFLTFCETGMGLFSGLVSSSGGGGCCGCSVALGV